MATQPIHDVLNDLTGTVKTFGEHGPMYQVMGTAFATTDGKSKVRILVIESGETLDYDLSKVLADPLKP